MKVWGITVVIMVGTLSLACAPQVRSAVFLEGLTPRPANAPVQIYQEQLPDCPYEEVGTVTVQQRNKHEDVQVSVDSMKQRARAMGGDAIIRFTQGDRTTGGYVAGNTVIGVDKAHLSGTVIRFTDSSCRPDSAEGG